MKRFSRPALAGAALLAALPFCSRPAEAGAPVLLLSPLAASAMSGLVVMTLVGGMGDTEAAALSGLLIAASAVAVVAVAEAGDAPGARDIALRDPKTGREAHIRVAESHPLARHAAPGRSFDLLRGQSATAISDKGEIIAIVPDPGQEGMYHHEQLD